MPVIASNLGHNPTVVSDQILVAVATHFGMPVNQVRVEHYDVWRNAMATQHPNQFDVVVGPVSTTYADTWVGGIDQAMSDMYNNAQQAVPKKPRSECRLDELLSFSRLSFDLTRCKKFEKENALTGPVYDWCTNDAIVGIEVEVENIRQDVPIQAFWGRHEDNSLRNFGVEFVSVPMNIKRVQLAVQHLFEALSVNNTPDFSNRTSIHIHLNCRDLTLDQIKTIVLLYCIFERHFYAFAGTRRLSSIFCVPVYRTNILSVLGRCVDELSAHWHKYCGINLLPLMSGGSNGNGYGTLEFRHLFGTADQRTILDWINNIIALRKAALEIKYDDLLVMIEEMNTSSSYQSLYHQVFEGIPKLLTRKIDFEECVSNVKRELFGDEYQNTIAKDSNSEYWQFCNNNGISG